MKVPSTPEPTPPLDATISLPTDPAQVGLPTPVADPTSAADAQARWPMWHSGVDLFLAMLVLATAFMVASHTARNSDQWTHYAVGRAIVKGQYTFGIDPLSFVTSTRTWVNHNWLLDVGSYFLYTADTTGATIVAVKAGLFMLAFGVLLFIRKPGQAWWPWVVVSALAVMAATPHTGLRPLVASAFFLAVTLYILLGREWKSGSWVNPIALGVLFCVWANSDSWFFLGPLCVLLVLIGEWLQAILAKGSPAGIPIGSLLKALGIGVVACMLNPHHVRVWQIPQEFGIGIPASVKTDQQFRLIALPTFDNFFLSRPELGWNLNVAAFAVLLFVGGMLLALAYGRQRISHALLWVAFAFLALMHFRSILFFAIVAVPLLATAITELTNRITLGTVSNMNTRFMLLSSTVVRLLAIPVLLTFVAAAYPGWLHPLVSDPAYMNRVTWAVEPDAGLVRTVAIVDSWRDSGKLPDSYRGLILSPDLANHTAWFSTKEKVFANSRYGYHLPELEDWLKVRKALVNRTGVDETDPVALREICRKYDISYIVITDSRNPPRELDLRPVIELTQFNGGYSLWHIDGRVAVIGETQAIFAKLAFDPVRLAFDPANDANPLPEPTRPTTASVKSPEFLDAFFMPSPKVLSVDALDSTTYYSLANLSRQNQVQQHNYIWPESVAAAISPMVADLAVKTNQLGRLVTPPPPSDVSVAFQLLSIRAARRAIAANPDNPDSYLALARAAGPGFVGIPGIPEQERIEQNVAGLRRFLDRLPPLDKLPPNSALMAYEIAGELSGRYQASGFIDLEQRTLTEARELLRRGADGIVDPEVKKKRIEQLDKALTASTNRLAAVNDPFDQYVSNAKPDVAQLINAAVQRRLFARAMDEFQKAVEEKRDLGPNALASFETILMIANIQLVSGRIEDATNGLEAIESEIKTFSESANPDARIVAQLTNRQRQLQVAMWRVTGNYAKLGEAYESDMLRQSKMPDDAKRLIRAALVGEMLPSMLATGISVPHASVGGILGGSFGKEITNNIVGGWDQQANFYLSRGLLSLQEGKVGDAERRFRQVLEPEGIALPPDAPLRTIAEQYLRMIAHAKAK